MSSRRASVLVIALALGACTKFTGDDGASDGGGLADGGAEDGATFDAADASFDGVAAEDAPAEAEAAATGCSTPLHSDDFEGEISPAWSKNDHSADTQMMPDNRRYATGASSLLVAFPTPLVDTHAELAYSVPFGAKHLCMEGSLYVESDGHGEVDLFAFANVDGLGADKTIGLVRSASTGFAVEYADAANQTREIPVTFPLQKWNKVRLEIDFGAHSLQATVGNTVLPMVSIPASWPSGNIAFKLGAFYVGKPGTNIAPTGPWSVSFDAVSLARE